MSIYSNINKFLVAAALASTILSASSCQSGQSSLAGELHNVDAVSFKLVVNNHNVQVLDVRTHSEYLKGHIPYAINIDINDNRFNEKIRESVDKDYPVAIYCLTGKRSAVASGILVDMGYEVYQLEDGIQGYQGQVSYGEN